MGSIQFTGSAMEEYKITLKTQAVHFMGIMYLLLISSIIIYLCIHFDISINGDFTALFVIFGIILSAEFFPELALHIDYYSVNKGDVLLYDSINRRFSFTHQDQQVTFSVEDIASLVLYKSFALHKKNAQFLTFDDYNHGIIILENGTKIVITSLMMGGVIKLPMPEEKVKVKANIYRWAKGPSLQLADK